MKPFAPIYSKKGTTRRYYACGRAAMTVKQTCETLDKAKCTAWCHTQVCPSHEVHIHKTRRGYVVTSHFFPKSGQELKRILAFTLGVARQIALNNCNGEAADMFDRQLKRIKANI